MSHALTGDADLPQEAVGPQETHEVDYLRAEGGVRSWLLTTDHKRIGLMFYGLVVLFLILGGLFAMVLRAELITPEPTLIEADTYNRMFTLHGVIMVWMFMIPSIPNVFGNFVLPLMLGAKDLAFPRLNLLSLYVFALGSVVTLGGAALGGTDTGWTFYAPYSTSTSTAVVPVVAGIFILGVSSIMTGLNFIVTTHTMRARGMSWTRVPLFVWAIYATSVIILFATPVLGMSITLVGIDHVYHFGIFDPRLGGDPVLFQHLFWFYSHPAVYIMILPAMGVISEVVCTFTHKPPASYKAIFISSLGIAFVGFFTWGHHMFVAGMSTFDAGVFGILSMFVAIFSAIKVFTWVATMHRGSIQFSTPMLYFLSFLFLFVFGGMTGVAVATQSLDVHWHDTYFVVAHFHFIMVGATLTGFLAAAHYWFPKMFGCLYSERVGMIGATGVFCGFFLTFFPQFLLGNAGMPRRYYAYPERFQWLNALSSGGAFLLGGALLLTLVNLLVALKRGRRADGNPWTSRSFEWMTPTLPPKHNFAVPPRIGRGPYDYHLTEEEAHARVSPG
ncbi:cytochrome c oxidase subunit I [Chondromyces apiculatus]|uniref:Cytochrome c oxidase polypeptide I n=1 Tax=Chondromyces apiculatus DSM 436 TaxID=1192034 RepID=A0A017TE76_9BACT|nr:cbb3-type cytochrome c oxidase subunit I [Chondromyces apiculatus]EYF06921.1 Cytochrome c oxidase polypeptide I [Chondromyces apiculatus DSM 436]